MKHLKYSDKSLLLDDATADALVRYATLVAANGGADNIDVNAFGADGDEVRASMMLSQGASIIAESTHSSLPDPDNSETLAYLLEHIALLESPPKAIVQEHPDTDRATEFDY